MFANGLPFELLSWIFSICWDDHRVPPERVALVNKYWRHVAINSSQLWTDVYYDEEADIPRMSLCLKRSGNLPVKLVMNITRTEIEDFAWITTLCSIISPHFHRVRTFRLSHRNDHVTDVGDDSSSLTAFLERIYCPSQSLLLQEFQLLSQRGLAFLPPSFLQRAQLRRLVSKNIDFLAYPFGASSQTLSSISITCEGTEDIYIYPIIPTLQTLQHLRELEIEIPDLHHDPVNQVSLPSLISLTIRRPTSVLLQQLVCPMLRTLSMDVWEDEGDEGIDPFMHVRFLCLHAETIISLDIRYKYYGTGIPDDVPDDVSDDVQCTTFPALTSLSGSLTMFALSYISGVSLTSVNIQICFRVYPQELADFFYAASGTLRTACITHYTPYAPWWGEGDSDTDTDTESPSDQKIVFACLESFTSWCWIGDTVMSATKEAPELRVLQLNGPLYDDEVPKCPAWVIVMIFLPSVSWREWIKVLICIFDLIGGDDRSIWMPRSSSPSIVDSRGFSRGPIPHQRSSIA